MLHSFPQASKMYKLSMQPEKLIQHLQKETVECYQSIHSSWIIKIHSIHVTFMYNVPNAPPPSLQPDCILMYLPGKFLKTMLSSKHQQWVGNSLGHKIILGRTKEDRSLCPLSPVCFISQSIFHFETWSFSLIWTCTWAPSSTHWCKNADLRVQSLPQARTPLGPICPWLLPLHFLLFLMRHKMLCILLYSKVFLYLCTPFLAIVYLD